MSRYISVVYDLVARCAEIGYAQGKGCRDRPYRPRR